MYKMLNVKTCTGFFMFFDFPSFSAGSFFFFPFFSVPSLPFYPPLFPRHLSLPLSFCIAL